MDTRPFIEDLLIQGIELWRDGEQLRYRGPKSSLTPATLATIKQNKRGILETLAGTIHPLSAGQEALWLAQQNGSNVVPNVSFALRIHTAIDVPALRRSFQIIVSRHPLLCVGFKDQPNNGSLGQRNQGYLALDFQEVDATEWDSDELATQVDYRCESPFDLERGPTMRVHLFRLSKQNYVLLFTLPPLVIDNFSMRLILDELGMIYPTVQAGGKPNWSPSEPSYVDYVARQSATTPSERERSQRYWQDKLAGGLPLLTLPTDHPRTSSQKTFAAFYTFQLSEMSTQQLRDLADEADTTLYTTLLAAFQVLLHHYSGQDDILVASPIADRQRPEFANVIGPITSPLVIRGDLSEAPSFDTFLAQTEQTVAAALEHGDYPLLLMSQQIRNLYQVVFDLREMHPADPLFEPFTLFKDDAILDDWGGLRLSPFPSHRSPSQVDLGLQVDLQLTMLDDGGKLFGSFEYNAALFEPGTIERLTDHFQVLLAGIVANRKQSVSDLPLMTQAQRHQLLVEWNDTQTDYPAHKCIHHLFEEQVERSPEDIAAVYGDEGLTYRELNGRANQLAHHLQRLGVGPEVLVGFCVERSIEMVVGLLAILKAGGAYIPLDPNYPPERLAIMLTDAQPQVLLSQSHLLDTLPNSCAKIITLDQDWPSDQPLTVPTSTIKPDNLAYVIYTSGSTGRPKGVQISHQALTNFLTTMQGRPGMTNHDILVAVTTLSFDIAALEIYLPLIVGAKLIIAPQDSVADGSVLQNLLHDYKATVMQATPTTWRLLLLSGWQNERDIKILCGGEVLPVQLAEQLLALSGSVWNLYGPTETTIWSTVHQVKEVTDKPISIGKGIANTSVYTLNQYLEPVPIGVVGDFYIGGAGLARGYLNLPESTAEKFIPNPFGPGRLYKTGDLARWLADGELEFLGRRDYQVKLRGFRIELGEIEAVLNQHSAVEQTTVDLKERAGGDKQLVAYIKPTPQKVDAASAEEHVTLWQTLYDQTYSQNGAQESTFNIAGWKSSYSGQPFAAEEMREWVDETVTRIMALKPQRVLEIGCGTGLLLARIAPHCEHYTGTDFSETALNHTRQMCQGLDNLGHVTLRKGLADDFSGFEANQYDTIILNSVVQYFPDINYLERVIAGALGLLKAEGFIFIGDVRHYDLLETFHTSVQMYQADDTTNVEQLKGQVQRHRGQEKELLLSPDFFLSLAQGYDPICHVQVQPKYGGAENELTKFRYDVILHVGHDVATQSEIVWHDWHKLEANPNAIENLLESEVAQTFGLRHVPNSRLQAESNAQVWLREAEPRTRVAVYRQRLGQGHEAGISLNKLRQLALSQGWQVEVSWLNMMSDGDFDLVFSRSSQPAQFTVRSLGSERSRYAHMPAQNKLAAQLIPHWRAYLKDKLPGYMLPADFVLLDEFPLTPNGKIDRRTLPQPDSSDLVTSSEFASPQTPTEEILARLWVEVLGLKQVGRYDNFIELGGHSLLATELIAHIRDTFKVDLPLRRLFETPTIAALADFIDHIQTANEQVSLSAGNISGANSSPPAPLRLPPHLITLQAEGVGRPLFLIHPLAGLVFPYYELALNLGPDQPIYGLQSLGIGGEASHLTQVEAMAEHYLAAIRQVQPEGPYQLAGWSFGGKLALEMAQQLQKGGQSVALLAIIDTRLFSTKFGTFWHGAIMFLTSILPHIWPYISDYLYLQSSALPRPEGAQQQSSWFFSKLKTLFQRAEPGGETKLPVFKRSEYKRLLRVLQANVQADSRYRLQRYPGRVTLFKTATRHQCSTWGWGDIAANGVDLHQIPGYHMNVLRPPQVQVLAEKLSACLAQPDEVISPHPPH